MAKIEIIDNVNDYVRYVGAEEFCKYFLLILAYPDLMETPIVSYACFFFSMSCACSRSNFVDPSIPHKSEFTVKS